MKIQIFSDIHAEGFRGKPSILWTKVTPQAPVAIVAGDIDSYDFEETITEIATKFEKVFCVFGNHEFYHKVIDWRPDMTKIPNNVTILDRNAEEYEGIMFMGCTLWTNFKHQDWFVMHASDDGINDFHQITANNGGTRFTAQMAYEQHQKEAGWLKLLMEQNRDKKTVVVTHFLPNYDCVHEKWKAMGTDMLNHYFNAGCDYLVNEAVEEGNVAAWVFGHTHDFRDLMFGDTRFVCNPMGYALGRERERNGEPYQDFIIEV